MTPHARTLYTGKVRTRGGRDGVSRSADGRLDLRLSSSGTAGTGTNPEQLFAAGWSACFEAEMQTAARRMNVTLPAGVAIEAEIDLNATGDVFFLGARLKVFVPGLERHVGQAIVDAAHQTCPYSKATRGNVDVALSLA